MIDNTFVKITNKDIYNELVNFGKEFGKTKTQIKLNTWIATTALTLGLFIVGVILR